MPRRQEREKNIVTKLLTLIFTVGLGALSIIWFSRTELMWSKETPYNFKEAAISPRQYYDFIIKAEKHEDQVINGSFSTNGLVHFYILDEANFVKWKEHQQYLSLDEKRSVTSYSFSFKPSEGVYHIIIDNLFDEHNAKSVVFTANYYYADYKTVYPFLWWGLIIFAIGFILVLLDP